MKTSDYLDQVIQELTQAGALIANEDLEKLVERILQSKKFSFMELVVLDLCLNHLQCE